MNPVASAMTTAEARAHRDRLADILVDCVSGGASIGFMDGFDRQAARAWWTGVLADAEADRLVLFEVRLGSDLVGAVQLGFAPLPNGRFRGDVRKLIVHREARNHGAAAALMGALEAEARARGLRTLVLDTAIGSTAERLYTRLGWTRAGTIPDYALWPDGRPCETTLFWKAL